MASLLGYFALVFAVTWTSWFAAWAAGGADAGHMRGVLPMVLLYVGTFAPGLVAIGLTARQSGTAGVGALLQRLFKWDVGLRWYVFAFSYMAVIKLIAALIHRAVTGAWPAFGHEAWYLMIAATVFSLMVGGQSGEEVGWRGYALPRMAARIGIGRASLLLGMIWAVWHLPLFFLPGTDTSRQSFAVYFLEVTAMSVTIAWLYARTGGSLLLTMLLHAAINNTKDIVPSAQAGATDAFALSTSLVAWLTALLLWLGAAWFLTRMPDARTIQ